MTTLLPRVHAAYVGSIVVGIGREPSMKATLFFTERATIIARLHVV